MTTLEKLDFNDQFRGLLSDYIWRNNVGYCHAGDSDEKEVAANDLAETSSIIVVVQKHRKALSLKRMSNFLSSQWLRFIEKTTSVKISEDALPQLTKEILRNHLVNVRRVKSI